MSTPMEILERHVAAFAAKDADAEPFAADSQVIEPGGEHSGREQILEWLGGYWEAFPDARLEIVCPVESGSRAAAEGRFSGTHTGTLRMPEGEVPPTGRKVEIRWAAIYEARGDELLSEHLYFDPTQFMTQLGLTPGATAEAAAAPGPSG
jgi:predicted ester cyclase